MRNLFYLTIVGFLVGNVLGCGDAKTKTKQNQKNQKTAKRQPQDKNKKSNKNLTTKGICLRIHDAGFRNGWQQRPRKLSDCENMLEGALKRHGEALGIFDECITRNKSEADYLNCIKPTMPKEGR